MRVPVGDKAALQLTSGVVTTTLQFDNIEVRLKKEGSNTNENCPKKLVVTVAIVVFAAPHRSWTLASTYVPYKNKIKQYQIYNLIFFLPFIKIGDSLGVCNSLTRTTPNGSQSAEN